MRRDQCFSCKTYRIHGKIYYDRKTQKQYCEEHFSQLLEEEQSSMAKRSSSKK